VKTPTKGNVMQHIIVPLSEVMTLIVNPETARISEDSTHMMAVIEDKLHIFSGDFKGIDTDESLEAILKRNLE
jgi:hypothetical protein